MKIIIQKNGYITIHVLVFATVAVLFLGALVGWSVLNMKTSERVFIEEQAFHIAESGVDYYLWRLAHSSTDFLTEPGPIVKEFLDKNGLVMGSFTLEITPPLLGSTLVEVRSTGRVDGFGDYTRTVVAQFAKPSIAKYSVVANDVMRFGAGTEVFGPIHSNEGIRFDGVAHNVVSSSVEDYNDPDDGVLSFGVQTRVSPADPSPPDDVPSRPDVFVAGRHFPVPSVDFVGITADLAQMKSDAQSDGFYRASSSGVGYKVVLKVDGTFDLYTVDGLVSPPSGCSDPGQDGWGTWSVQSDSLIGNFPLPTNGIIFLEDEVFVEVQVNGVRLTIVAAQLPDNPTLRKSITINNDLMYTNYDGTDVIGLIAQKNVNIGWVSEDELRIDAALIAQYGRVGRYYYRKPWWIYSRCSPYHERQEVTLWGMIATNNRYGFAYTDGTGYQIRNLYYDGSLLYGPPPSFPLTSDQYEIISWDEE